MEFTRIWVSKIVMAVALIYLLWLELQCPCPRLLCCHLPQFWGALAVIIGVAAFENGGLRFSDASCVAP